MISMEEKIAIVIPAYKCRFLRQTLDSIVVQTCRSFTVYIGDDASPQNLKEIVSDYADKMNIVYRRFDTNLGGVDLPGHWDRCIALAKEPVIWFFSDDDLMPQDGVERIIKALECYGTRHGMFRFPLAVIDENGKIIQKILHCRNIRFRAISFCWINWKEEFIRLLVNMFLLVIYMNG